MPGTNSDLTTLPTGVTTGANLKYTTLYPQVQGRALHHDEMDYNLDLVGHVINGYRIIGSASGGEIDTSVDMNKVLKLHTVDANDLSTLPTAFAGTNVGDIVWIMATGASGGSGTDGTSGVDGVGSTGTHGTDGTSGVAGNHGSSGTDGTDGTTGTDGTSGIGTDGTDGTSGTDGTHGTSGSTASPLYTSMDGAFDETTATVGEVPSGYGNGSSPAWNGVAYDDLFDQIFFAYQDPTINLYDADSVNGSNYLEVGQYVGQAAGAVGNNTSPGSPPYATNFSWSTSNSGNVAPNSVEIKSVTGGTSHIFGNGGLAVATANDGSEAHPAPGINVRKTSTTSHQWQARCEKQDGGVPLGTFTGWNSVTMHWRYRVFYGVNATNVLTTQTQIQALSSNHLATDWDSGGAPSGACSGNAVSCYSFNPAGEYIWFAVPFGSTPPNCFNAANNFGVTLVQDLTQATISVTNQYGVAQNYECWRCPSPLNAAIVVYF
tara:strand:+ start:2351 stop:3817 length:1467 start_codon:yes stop_codon:yes gene_type:complete